MFQLQTFTASDNLQQKIIALINNNKLQNRNQNYLILLN